jgi:type IV secretory pathway VirB3-like protein
MSETRPIRLIVVIISKVAGVDQRSLVVSKAALVFIFYGSIACSSIIHLIFVVATIVDDNDYVAVNLRWLLRCYKADVFEII